MRIHHLLTGQMSKSMIIAESGEGIMHDLRSLRMGSLAEWDATSIARPWLSLHIEDGTLYARGIFREECAGLVWKLFPHPAGVFGTLLERPSCHIMQKHIQ